MFSIASCSLRPKRQLVPLVLLQSHPWLTATSGKWKMAAKHCRMPRGRAGQGRGCDGWVCLTRAGVEGRDGSLPAETGSRQSRCPLCSEHPGLVRMRGTSLSSLRQPCQNRRPPYSAGLSWLECGSASQEPVRWVCDSRDVSARAAPTPCSSSRRQCHGSVRQLQGDFMPYEVLHSWQQNSISNLFGSCPQTLSLDTVSVIEICVLLMYGPFFV